MRFRLKVNTYFLAAVLLWIYGGGFSTGSSNNPGYVGKYIADKQDVIVVSIKYVLPFFHGL